MTSKVLIALVLAFSLCGCGVGPGLTGNSTGGIIPWTPENQLVARDWAATHCAYYNKVAEMGRIYARYGEYISFICQFDKTGPSFRHAR